MSRRREVHAGGPTSMIPLTGQILRVPLLPIAAQRVEEGSALPRLYPRWGRRRATGEREPGCECACRSAPFDWLSDTIGRGKRSPKLRTRETDHHNRTYDHKDSPYRWDAPDGGPLRPRCLGHR